MAIDLCQLHYQILLITCLEFMINNVKNAWKEKKIGWIVNSLHLKMVDWIINVKSVKNHTLSHQMNQLKTFQLYINFEMVI